MYWNIFTFYCFGINWMYLSIPVIGQKFADIKDDHDIFKILKENDVGEENVTISTIEQPVDHFDSNNTNKWLMRYFQRNNLFQLGGPIVVFIGGEFSAEPIWISTGLCYDIAKEMNGTLIMSEHRYYGESYPVADKADLRYLHSRQALADLANLIKYLKSLPDYHKSKVLLIGGSYPGMMAAWMRMLYPDVIDAALASSAPVKLVFDNKRYLEHISKVFSLFGGKDCHRRLQLIFMRYMNLLQTNRGIEVLKKENNICATTNLKKPEHKTFFIFNKIIEVITVMKEGVPEDVVKYCNKIKENPNGGVTSAFTSLINEFGNTRRFTQSENLHCFDINLEEETKKVKASEAGNWIYQKCNEFGLATTTNAQDTIFPRVITENFMLNACKRMFGDYYTLDQILQNVEKTNRLFEENKANASNILFTNGEMDAYSVNGITESVSEGLLVVLIPRASHSLDLASISKRDGQSLQEAKRDIKDILLSWIK